MIYILIISTTIIFFCLSFIYNLFFDIKKEYEKTIKSAEQAILEEYSDFEKNVPFEIEQSLKPNEYELNRIIKRANILIAIVILMCLILFVCALFK